MEITINIHRINIIYITCKLDSESLASEIHKFSEMEPYPEAVIGPECV